MKPQHLLTHLLPVLALLATLLLTACSSEDASTNNAGTSLPDSIFLSEVPEGIQSISSLKSTAKEGDEVVVHVVVGGTTDPIVQGRASAAIIDAGIQNPCLREDDHCPTPWDYCCTPQENRTANLATLQITDEAGNILKADLAPSIEPLSKLVVKGVVGPRPDDQVLTINATGIYMMPKAQ